MSAPVVYDLTRLGSRLLNTTPNGIDRVDFAYADHFLRAGSGHFGFGLFPWGQRVIRAHEAQTLVAAVAGGWGESGANETAAQQRIEEFLRGSPDTNPQTAPRRIQAPRPGRVRNILALPKLAAFPGLSPKATTPRGAVYLNVSQFPLWFPPYFRWLRDRSDIAVVTMIHDLLPLDYPEYFRGGEYERHRRRLAFVAERAAAAIVTTQETKRALLAHVARLGRTRLPVHVAALPVSPIFSGPPPAPDPALREAPYFVMCGTIEPRKNHLLMLQIWREMVAAQGAAAPKLLIIGKRGWENEGAIDMLERCRAIQSHVMEISGLSTVALKRLMENARAMLAPSFCEGYGLPVVEARAVGVPLIASDIAVFREIAGPEATFVSPLDGPGWMRAILDHAKAPRLSARARWSGPSWPDYFTGLETFLATVGSSDRD